MADSSLLSAAQTYVLRPEVFGAGRRGAPNSLARSGNEDFIPKSPSGEDQGTGGQQEGGGRQSPLVGTQNPLRGLSIPVTTVDSSFLMSNGRPDSTFVQRAAAAYQSSQGLGEYASTATSTSTSGANTAGAQHPTIDLIA